ncbi:hypothetical protein [Novosphingobium sp. BL-52-GroH]|uniref:hypothetical protein n=1 Tax=Novosphingobium sp. BL-52-GroH TaxID=3349877 RepID=UPI00384E7485
MNQKERADRAAYWDETEQRIVTAYNFEKTLRTPTNFVVHSLQEVNDALEHGRLFFMNILSDEIFLYESDDKPLKTPVPKTPELAFIAVRTLTVSADCWSRRQASLPVSTGLNAPLNSSMPRRLLRRA